MGSYNPTRFISPAYNSQTAAALLHLLNNHRPRSRIAPSPAVASPFERTKLNTFMAEIRPTQSYMNTQVPHHYGHPGSGEMTVMPSDESAATLLIRHLPEAIPHDTLSRIFSHYGASSVRQCTSGRVRNCAFVDFRNDVLASQAQQRLNGLHFMGKVLSVERATKQSQSNDKSQQIRNQSGIDSALLKNTALVKDLRVGQKDGSCPSSEPIAERLGVDYQFPPHLEYAYPPPDGNILTNILNALIAVPRFYTQVLHLMNKMNIPAPFRIALPTPPLPSSLSVPPPPPPQPPVEDLSSDESELASSDDESEGKESSGIRGVSKRKRKRVKREPTVGPAVDKDAAHKTFEIKPAVLVSNPVIKKKNPVIQINIVTKKSQNDQVDEGAAKETEESDKESVSMKPYATPEELEMGKLPPEEILSLPMFKNYNAGNPAPVLYIKNLAKDVVVDDFYYVFGSFFGSIEAAKSSVSVKLMQEGRMRGQAFVTFPSIELAHNAMTLANGYMFKGKPLIIQFGRNPNATK